MKKFVAGVLVLFGLISTAVAWAQSPALDRIKKEGVVRVGVKTDYKPFGHLDPSGRAVGLEADLAEVTMRPENPIELNGEDAARMQKLIDVLEDLDDVQEVYHSAELEE